jgi:asparagine synthase (glutamine-hydrolysing)
MRWFEQDLSGRIQAILRDPAAKTRDYFDPAGLDRLLDSHFSGAARHTEVIFRLLLLELWQRRFVEEQAL